MTAWCFFIATMLWHIHKNDNKSRFISIVFNDIQRQIPKAHKSGENKILGKFSFYSFSLFSRLVSIFNRNTFNFYLRNNISIASASHATTKCILLSLGISKNHALFWMENWNKNWRWQIYWKKCNESKKYRGEISEIFLDCCQNVWMTIDHWLLEKLESLLKVVIWVWFIEASVSIWHDGKCT